MNPQNPQPQKPKRNTGCVTFTIIGVVILALLGFGGCAALVSTAGGDAPSADPTGAAPAATHSHRPKAHATPSDEPTATTTTEPEWTPKPKPKKTHHPKVTFHVEGSAPGGVDIMYGSDSDNRQGHGLPFTATLPLDDDAMYYMVNAQLSGGGDITCTVTVDGQTKKAHASGGYNICDAQLNGGLFGGWS